MYTDGSLGSPLRDTIARFFNLVGVEHLKAWAREVDVRQTPGGVALCVYIARGDPCVPFTRGLVYSFSLLPQPAASLSTGA